MNPPGPADDRSSFVSPVLVRQRNENEEEGGGVTRTARSGRIKKKNIRRVGGVGGPWRIGRETALEVDEGVDEGEEEEDDDEAEEEVEEERWARVAIKRTPCRVARGNPSQKTVIGNTFPPFFLK